MASKNDATHGIHDPGILALIVRCRLWHRFWAMSGLKKQPNFVPAINFPTSANSPSNQGKHIK